MSEAQQIGTLLLAAKAAGYRVDIVEGQGLIEHGPQTGDVRSWNPLSSEGDRYRLARDLNMTIEFDTHNVCVRLPNGVYAWVPWGPGPEYEATTDAEAIVLAAAELGGLMP